MKGLIKSILLVVFGAILLLAFNNCEELGSGKPGAGDSKSLSNGEGYSGVQYNSYDVLNACFTDINEPVSTVSIIDGQPFLTREDCQDIDPEPINEDIISEHNKEIALYQDRLFDRSDFTASEILCRGNRIDPNTGYQEVADIQIRVDSNGDFFSNIKLGLFDNGRLIRSAATRDYAVDKKIVVQQNGLEIINYMPTQSSAQSGVHYLMAVRKDPNDGKLYSIIHRIQDVQGPAGQNVENAIAIEMMECFMHEEFPGSGGERITPNQQNQQGPQPSGPPPGQGPQA